MPEVVWRACLSPAPLSPDDAYRNPPRPPSPRWATTIVRLRHLSMYNGRSARRDGPTISRRFKRGAAAGGSLLQPCSRRELQAYSSQGISALRQGSWCRASPAPIHGLAVVPVESGGLQGGASMRRPIRPRLPDDDDRRRHPSRRPAFASWAPSRRAAGVATARVSFSAPSSFRRPYLRFAPAKSSGILGATFSPSRRRTTANRGDEAMVRPPRLMPRRGRDFAKRSAPTHRSAEEDDLVISPRLIPVRITAPSPG